MTTRTATNENSVLFALSELTALENDRVARERKAAEEKAAAEARRAKAVLEAEKAQAAEMARLEQLRALAVEAEAKAKAQAESERDQRMAAMRAELDAISGERAQLRAELMTRAAAPEAPRRGYGLAFGLSSVVAAGLAGLLVMQAQARPVVIPSSAPVAVAPVVVEAPVVELPAVEAAPEVVVEAPVAPAVTRPRGETRPHRHDDREVTRPEPHHDLGLDFGDDEGLLPTDAHRSR